MIPVPFSPASLGLGDYYLISTVIHQETWLGAGMPWRMPGRDLLLSACALWLLEPPCGFPCCYMSSLSVCLLLLLGWPEVRSGAWATPNLLRTDKNDTTECQYRLLSSLSFSIRQGAHL